MAAKESNIIKKHILVPKHEKMTKEEEKNFFESVQFEKESLPRIRFDDAALVGIDPKIGDVIKIERKSATAGIAYFYRVVSNE